MRIDRRAGEGRRRRRRPPAPPPRRQAGEQEERAASRARSGSSLRHPGELGPGAAAGLARCRRRSGPAARWRRSGSRAWRASAGRPAWAATRPMLKRASYCAGIERHRPLPGVERRRRPFQAEEGDPQGVPGDRQAGVERQRLPELRSRAASGWSIRRATMPRFSNPLGSLGYAAVARCRTATASPCRPASERAMPRALRVAASACGAAASGCEDGDRLGGAAGLGEGEAELPAERLAVDAARRARLCERLDRLVRGARAAAGRAPGPRRPRRGRGARRSPRAPGAAASA